MVVLVSAFVSLPVFAQDGYQHTERTGEKMIADMLLLRPAGFVAALGGTAVFIISSPLSAIGDNLDEAFEKLVVKPTKYTFDRPLGEF
jgi:hypothetical protein